MSPNPNNPYYPDDNESDPDSPDRLEPDNVGYGPGRDKPTWSDMTKRMQRLMDGGEYHQWEYMYMTISMIAYGLIPFKSLNEIEQRFVVQLAEVAMRSHDPNLRPPTLSERGQRECIAARKDKEADPVRRLLSSLMR